MSNNIPIYQDSAGYVDVNVSYALRDNVTLYFNGSNVTGEIEDYYARFAKGKTQYIRQNEFEPRYTAGCPRALVSVSSHLLPAAALPPCGRPLFS